MPPYRARLAALALVATLAMTAACGGGDDGGKTPDATPTPVPTQNPAISPGPGVSNAEIKLGMTADLNGTGDTPYGAIATALQAYIAKVNIEDGGVCGRQLTLLAEDDVYSPETSLAQTRKLVENDQVFAIVGGTGTLVHQPAAAYLNDPNNDTNATDGVPDLFLSTGWSGWADVVRFPWSVGYIPDYSVDARILAKYINTNFAGKKVGLLYQDDEFGRDYQAALKPALANPDLLVYQETYAADAEALTGQVRGLKDARAEVVVLASNPSLTAQVYIASAAEGYTPALLLSYVNTPSGLASAIGGGVAPEQLVKGFEALAGSVWTTYLLSAVEDERADAMIEHQRIMDTYGGPQLSTLSIYAQSTGELLVHTLGESCSDLSRAGVMRALEKVDRFRSSLMIPGVQISFAHADHRAIETEQPVVIQADGTLKLSGGPISVDP